MTSLLLSTLRAMSEKGDLTAFTRRYPHPWLIWEPGTWRPTRPTTTIISTRTTQDPATSGEGLAMSLAPRQGRDGQISVGRAPECDLVINDGTVSSLHLVLILGQGGWLVKDAGSTNGTTFRGARLAPGVSTPLRSGEEIVAGDVRLTFYLPEGMYARLMAGQ
jgi:pSer/pThr/pTyr-binding forkhead associated (FHA) protein